MVVIPDFVISKRRFIVMVIEAKDKDSNTPAGGDCQVCLQLIGAAKHNRNLCDFCEVDYNRQKTIYALKFWGTKLTILKR